MCLLMICGASSFSLVGKHASPSPVRYVRRQFAVFLRSHLGDCWVYESTVCYFALNLVAEQFLSIAQFVPLSTLLFLALCSLLLDSLLWVESFNGSVFRGRGPLKTRQNRITQSALHGSSFMVYSMRATELRWRGFMIVYQSIWNHWLL